MIAETVQKYPTSKLMKCKIGSTNLQTVLVDLRQRSIKVGSFIKIKEFPFTKNPEIDVKYQKWIFVYITHINSDGLFFATR